MDVQKHVRTFDDVEFMDVGYLGAVAEGLAAYAGVGKRAADGEVEVVGPRPRGESVREGGMQHVHPKLLAAGVDVAAVDRDGEAGGGPAGERRHVHDDAPGRGRLAPNRVAAAAGGHRERGEARARCAQQRGDFPRVRRVEHGRRRRIDVGRHVAKV